MAAALLVSQAINFGILFAERQRASHNQIEAPPMSRFVALLQRVAATPPAGRAALLAERSRRGRFAIGAESAVPAQASDARIVARLRDEAQENGVALRDARAAISDQVELPRRISDQLSPEESAHAQER